MSFEVLEEAPARDSLTPLSEFQAETPATFFGERPVLHFQSSAKILISKADLEANEIFQKLEKSSQFDWTNESGPSDETAIPEVSVWALSTKFIIFSNGASGISIPYPSIALHARGTRRSTLLPGGQSDVVYLQLNLHDPETINSDDEIQTVDLTIIPSDVSYPTAEEITSSSESPSPGSLLFDALSACANLHPDPASPGSDGEPEIAPGTGGWITAENMSDFLDADGNFVGISSLGPGAGVIHAREEETEEVNGADETEDTKWQRSS